MNLDRDTGIAWPHAATEGFDDSIEVTLIAYEDPVFDILKRNRSDIERFVGQRMRMQTFPQAGYRAVLDRSLTDTSTAGGTTPLLIAIPFPWLAELCEDGHLLGLRGLQAESSFSGADFYDAVWQAGWFDEELYAIALQPTVDFLWYRQDLLEADGLEPPRCFDDVLRIAARMHRPRLGRAGISWNSASGLPLAETFLQILGAQGGVEFDDGVLQVDTETGMQVIEYLRALVPVSPAHSSSVDWARNARLFGSGKAAMCYHWSNRFGVLDSHALLQKGGRVGLQLHPTCTPGMTPLSPLGGALLAIPLRNSEVAARRAWRTIETLTSPELMKYFVLHGAAGSARHSVAEDRYVRQRNRVVEVIDRLANDRQIRTFPPVPLRGYRGMTQILSGHLEPLLRLPDRDVRKTLRALQRALVQQRCRR
ncbi:extracellular solute-binding protein [Paraburkholderia sp. A1RI-2L]|uniref:ABC transporter substrate-binding protein n=1 Tax=Paraburkholderia sp. A1RI-2L TaxID=3028367 RepID=UPI003B801082